MANTTSPLSGSPASTKIEGSPSAPATNLPAAPAPQKPKSKPRKRVNTAEKRHQHNAIERQRRETLNGKFLGLARLLPSLASHRRPSKSAIVNGSIAHLTHQRDQRLLASRLLRQLCAERDALAKECNTWRNANGHSAAVAVSGWTDDMEEVCTVEKEVFGNFATMQEDDGDDNDNDNDNDQDVNLDMSIEQAAAVAASLNSTGLITPRSSTDIDPLTHAFGAKAAQAQAMSQPSLSGSWASEFNFPSMSVSSGSAHANLPFNAFMSDSMDSMSGSPTGSYQSGIPTPPTTADFHGFTHTPSPRSTHSFEEQTVPQQVQNNSWTSEQLQFLQSIGRPQTQPASHNNTVSLPQVSGVAQNQNQGFNPALFNNSFVPQNFANSDAFTQTLIASMFPQQSNVHVGNAPMPQQPMLQQQPQHQQMPQLSRAQTEQLDLWRKLAIGGMLTRSDSQPAVNEIKPLRTGMGLGGMSLGSIWEQQQVKGF